MKTLIKFYMIEPVKPQIELRPYLGPELYIANVTDSKRRDVVEKTLKHLFSNRPRHKRKEEIYHWEKIYKVISRSQFFSTRLNNNILFKKFRSITKRVRWRPREDSLKLKVHRQIAED